jgi:beta-glucosidase
MALDDRSFAFWDVANHDWRVEPGTFEIAVGRSSRDIRHAASVEID